MFDFEICDILNILNFKMNLFSHGVNYFKNSLLLCITLFTLQCLFALVKNDVSLDF